MSTTKTLPVVPPALAYDYLARALQLLEQPCEYNKPNSWIQGYEAITQEGLSCAPESELAVAWCTIGVVRAVTHYDQAPDAAYRYILALLNMANPIAIAQNNLPSVNDTHTFQVVQRMFQKAKVLTIKFGD